MMGMLLVMPGASLHEVRLVIPEDEMMKRTGEEAREAGLSLGLLLLVLFLSPLVYDLLEWLGHLLSH